MSEQKKPKREKIGSVYYPRNEGQSFYIKLDKDVSLQKGDIVRLESKEYQLESLGKAASEGKLSEDLVKKIEERLNKIPEFVHSELVLVHK